MHFVRFFCACVTKNLCTSRAWRSAPCVGAPFCSPCMCTGTLKYVHVGCLGRWCRETGVVSCELCTSTFPRYFVDEGKHTRQARARAELETREASNRLQRHTSDFQRHHGRPPMTAMDFAIINLNSMLEAESAARAQSRGSGGDATQSGRGGGGGGGGSGPRGGVQVVVIDSMGNAQTLSARNIGQLSLAGMRDVRVLHGDMDVDELIGDDRQGHMALTGAGADGGLIIGPRGQAFYANEDARLRTDLEHVHSNTQVRFWMKVVITMLCSFLVLYAVVAVVGGDSSSHSSPIFIFRLLGFTLPLALISRAVWLFRRRRQVLVNQMNELFEFHGNGMRVHRHLRGGPNMDLLSFDRHLQLRSEIRRDLRGQHSLGV